MRSWRRVDPARIRRNGAKMGPNWISCCRRENYRRASRVRLRCRQVHRQTGPRRCVRSRSSTRGPLPFGSLGRRRLDVTAMHRCAADHAHGFGPADLNHRLPPVDRTLPVLRLNREPFGDAIAGAPGGHVSSRALSAGIKRSGIGTERRPASDFGLPSTSLPPTWVIDRRTRIRRAPRSTSSFAAVSDQPPLRRIFQRTKPR